MSAMARSARERTPQAHLASRRFFDHQLGSEVIKILPGEFYVASGPLVLATVLGSCVAACLWDPLTRIGGMNHFMLADAEEGRSADSMRYGLFAMNTLIEQLVAAGALKHCLQAKVFGGARVLSGESNLRVGHDNHRFVLDYLAQRKIPLLAQDLGGNTPRKLLFFPETGKVMVKRMTVEDRELADHERRYRRQIEQGI